MRINVALEELLEVDKLAQAEEAANATSGAAVQKFEDVSQTKAVEELKTEADAGDTSLDDPSATSEDPSTDVVTPEDDPDATPDDTEDKTDEVQDVPAQEAFRSMEVATIAMEDFSSVYQSAKDGLGSAAGKAYRAIALIASGLAGLGIAYGPTVASGLFKGVLYTFAKLGEVVLATSTGVEKYLDSKRNSLMKLKNDIEAVKGMLTDAKNTPNPVDMSGRKYTNRKSINQLKIGSNVDFTKTIGVLASFLDVSMGKLQRQIGDDFEAILHLAAGYRSGLVKNPVVSLAMPQGPVGLEKGTVTGYEPSSEWVDAYHATVSLPGDVLFLAEFPKQELKTMDDIANGYRDSKMYLGINQAGFKKVESVDMPSVEVLEKFIQELEHLHTACVKHQTLYEGIKKSQPGLALTLKKHFIALAESQTKVRFNDSLVMPIYLKTAFISKVYLVGAMDLNDYSTKTIANGLSYVRDTLKQMV